MNIELILNKALNKALCSKERIKQPNSNEIAHFVSEFMTDEAINFTGSSLDIKEGHTRTFDDWLKFNELEDDYEYYLVSGNPKGIREMHIDYELTKN